MYIPKTRRIATGAPSAKYANPVGDLFSSWANFSSFSWSKSEIATSIHIQNCTESQIPDL